MRAYVAAVSFDDPGLAVYGPFDSDDSAVHFGEAWQVANEDDHRWNVFHASGELTSVEVIPPSAWEDLEP